MSERTSVATWIRFGTGVADQAVAGTVESMQRAITDANFRWVGPLGRPVKVVHDQVVDRTWRVVHAVLRGSGQAAARVADHRVAAAAESPGAARARAIAVGSLDAGLFVTSPDLDRDMVLMVDGCELSPDARAIAHAHPRATGTVVVFVHGLVDTEAIWTSTSLPELATASGATALLVRYGTGRSIARNGADLDDLLDAVVTGWPVPVGRLVVVAHSMGGLVTRSAIRSSDERDRAWPGLLSDVVLLATPHLGSWLEKVANVTSWTLRHASPRTAPLGEFLDHRSQGIKDLRHGTIEQADDGDRAVGGMVSVSGVEVPWPTGVRHHLVVGRRRPDPAHVVNAIVGDGLVRATSAAGAGRWRRVPAGGPVEVTEVVAGHNQLAGHPRVADVVQAVLADA